MMEFASGSRIKIQVEETDVVEGIALTTVTFPGLAYFEVRLDDGGVRGFNLNYVTVEVIHGPQKIVVSREKWNKAVDDASLALRDDVRNSTPYPLSVARTVLLAALPHLGIEIESTR